MKVYRHPSLKKSEVKTFIICGDLHGKHLNINCWDKLKSVALRCIDPILIINGDFLDTPYLMPKSPEFRRFIKQLHGIEEYFLPLYNEEIEWGNAFFDDASRFFKEIIFLKGNHDERILYFQRDFCPVEYKYHFDLSRSLNLNKRNIKLIPYNSWYDIEKLAITHGIYHGAGTTPHRKHYIDAAKSVIFSHIHRDDVLSIISRDDIVKVWSLPAMCDLNPYYIKNSDTAWVNGFAVVNFYNGKFWVNIFDIWGNEIVLPNGDII